MEKNKQELEFSRQEMMEEWDKFNKKWNKVIEEHEQAMTRLAKELNKLEYLATREPWGINMSNEKGEN